MKKAQLFPTILLMKDMKISPVVKLNILYEQISIWHFQNVYQFWPNRFGQMVILRKLAR